MAMTSGSNKQQTTGKKYVCTDNRNGISLYALPKRAENDYILKISQILKKMH